MANENSKQSAYEHVKSGNHGAGDVPEKRTGRIKDSKKFAATGGRGFAQFNKDGKPAGNEMMTSWFPCHQAIKARDFVCTRYAP